MIRHFLKTKRICLKGAVSFSPRTGALESAGFTLIETLVAISLLAVAITAPMSLVAKSLATAFYARDQVTAFHLAQEAIEVVRHLRDHNVLLVAQGTPTDLLDGIPVGQRFAIDTLNDQIWTEGSWGSCPSGEAPFLKTDGTFYGHGSTPCDMGEGGWEPSIFRRYAEASAVAFDGSGVPQEIQISVTVSWQPSVFQTPREITISENLYRWVNDSSVI
jgi:prepilin-type N-terminal cleavage/methylation domain-containing protein